MTIQLLYNDKLIYIFICRELFCGTSRGASLYAALFEQMKDGVVVFRKDVEEYSDACRPSAVALTDVKRRFPSVFRGAIFPVANSLDAK
jgi:hypothetical protein